MSWQETFRAVIATMLAAAILFALGLAASPQLHARLHPDAGSPEHECAVTLIATGKYQQASAPLVIVAPQPALLFATVDLFAPVWVPDSFARAAVFEHAPPALS
jgi:hypothetical protein